MGIKITTDSHGVKIWRSDKYRFPQYAIGIQKKMDDGTYVTEYKAVRFRKGVELNNGEEIRIYDAFPTLEVWADKQTGEKRQKEVWMILDFDYVTQQPPMQPQPETQRAAANYAPQQAPAPQPSQMGFDDLPPEFSATEDDIPF